MVQANTYPPSSPPTFVLPPSPPLPPPCAPPPWLIVQHLLRNPLLFVRFDSPACVSRNVENVGFQNPTNFHMNAVAIRPILHMNCFSVDISGAQRHAHVLPQRPDTTLVHPIMFGPIVSCSALLPKVICQRFVRPKDPGRYKADLKPIHRSLLWL